MNLKGEELYDAIDEGTEVACEPWRWGTIRTYVFEKDGKHYRFTALFHSEEGVQEADSGVTAEEVVSREKTIVEWVPTPTKGDPT